MKKKALIILFTDELSPRQQLMVDSLVKNGWKVLIIAWDRGTNKDIETYSLGGCDWYKINIRAPISDYKIIYKLPKYYMSILGIFNNLKEKPHLITLTHYFCLPMVLFFKKYKVVYDASEMFLNNLLEYFGSFNKIGFYILNFIEKFFVSNVNGITTVDSKDDFLYYNYIKYNSNVQVIWNVPAIYQDADPDEVEKINNEFNGKKLITYVGGLMKEKGFLLALEVAGDVKEHYEEVMFIFIGHIKEDHKIINHMIDKYKISDNILIMEHMDYKKMQAYLSCSSVGLALYQKQKHYSQISQGNARKYFTYMQASLPIIAPYFDQAGKIVKSHNCGILVDTSNSKDISNAICYLLSDSKSAEKLGGNGRKAFMDTLNWEHESKKYIAFINNI